MFSRRANNVTPSFTVELNARIAELNRSGEDIIKLNIGEPDFNTPDNIKDAAKAAIDNNFTRYTPIQGIPDLRKAIIDKLREDNGVEYTMNEVCVTTGAKQALFEAALTLADEGDEVIIPTPCWVSYVDMVKIAGGIPVQVPAVGYGKDRYHLDLEAIAKAVTPRTTAIIINSPNNPASVVYTREELEGLVALAVENDFWIISDEVYEKLLYDGSEHICVASISPEAKAHTVVVNGCSKSYAMTGWRLGYAAGPENCMKKIRGLQGHITSGINSITQKAGVEAIMGQQRSVEAMRQEFDRRRQMMGEKLRAIPHVETTDSLGAFYYLPDVSWYFGKKWQGGVIENSIDMATYLLETVKVAVVPGDAFYAPGCLRLSYSNSMENLEKGLDRLASALAALRRT